MNATEAGLLRAVIDVPDDDGPRKVMADWLDERQDPRGEFIRVQCRFHAATVEAIRYPVAGMPRELSEEIAALGRRGRELLEWYWEGWLQPLPLPTGTLLSALEFRRGFVEHVVLDWPAWRDHGDALRAATPLRTVRLTTWPDVWYWYGDDGASGSYALSLLPLTPVRPDVGRAERPDRFGVGAVGTLLEGRWPGLAFELPPAEFFIYASSRGGLGPVGQSVFEVVDEPPPG